MGALLSERTEVDGGPGAEGAPAFRDLLEQRFGPVLVGDLGVEAAFRARKDVLTSLRSWDS